jgi:hypothetical protein
MLQQSFQEIFGAVFGALADMWYKIHLCHHKNDPNTLNTEKEVEFTFKIFLLDVVDLSKYPKDTSTLKDTFNPMMFQRSIYLFSFLFWHNLRTLLELEVLCSKYNIDDQKDKNSTTDC